MTVVINPEILAVRKDQIAAFGAFDITTLPTAEGRAMLDAAGVSMNDGTPKVSCIIDHVIDGPGGPLRLREIRPVDRPDRIGAILYIHGGGWFACNVETHDRMMRVLALESGCTVIGVDYRLSPEHVFPAALHDCIAAWEWIGSRADALRIDTACMAVAGDSAGGNLALALAIERRDNELPMPIGIATAYACLAPGLDTESSRMFGRGGYGLTHERMQWYWNHYLGPAKDDPPPLATPLHAALAGLPPIFLGIAEADTVSGDSQILHDRVSAAGGDATLSLWRGAVHGFLQMTRDVAIARDAVREMALHLADCIANRVNPR